MLQPSRAMGDIIFKRKESQNLLHPEVSCDVCYFAYS